VASCITEGKKSYQSIQNTQARLDPLESKTQKFKENFSTYCIYSVPEFCCAERILGFSGFGGVVVAKKQAAEAAGTDLKVTKLIHFGKQVNTVIL